MSNCYVHANRKEQYDFSHRLRTYTTCPIVYVNLDSFLSLKVKIHKGDLVIFFTESVIVHVQASFSLQAQDQSIKKMKLKISYQVHLQLLIEALGENPHLICRRVFPYILLLE